MADFVMTVKAFHFAEKHLKTILLHASDEELFDDEFRIETFETVYNLVEEHHPECKPSSLAIIICHCYHLYEEAIERIQNSWKDCE